MKGRSQKDPGRRVVVTGLGVVSSLGIGVEDFWRNLIAGKSGISEIESFDTSAYTVHKGGEVKDFRPTDFIDRRRIPRLGRASQMAIAASRLAMEVAQLAKDEVAAAGVFLGTTMGESNLIEEMNVNVVKDEVDTIRLSNIFLYPTNSISVNVAIELGCGGHNVMFTTACAAGNYSISYAFDLIRTGEFDVIFAGGSDAFSRIAFTGFNRLLAMAPEKCQPFDKNRKGMMLGEGAGVLLLESLDGARRRKANIYAEVLGYGLSCDAHHMTQPSEEGVARCMSKALLEAGVVSEEVDYISAHGTGTPQNDRVECAAIGKVFGDRARKIPCSSIKSMLGHAMGAASALEAISCCIAIKGGIIPPTINFEMQDEDCDIDCVPNQARKSDIEVSLNNSYAFGGNNNVVVFKRSSS